MPTYNDKIRTLSVINALKELYPNAGIELDFRNAFELIVAVALSAQCTDVRVNKVTPALFAKYPTAADLAVCDMEELERLIFSTGFYKNKAKNLRGMADILVRDHGGEVPDDIEKLILLPGVGRKTATVVLYNWFGRCDGITVDTHVMRVAGKLGLISKTMAAGRNAIVIERHLMKIVPREDWGLFTHLLIFHGRRRCIARRPDCKNCHMYDSCVAPADF